jgi:hypothetical protein
MVRACSVNGAGEECMQDIGGKVRNKEITEKTKYVGGWIIFREVGWGGVDLIGLAQDRGQWRSLVSTVIYILVS